MTSVLDKFNAYYFPKTPRTMGLNAPLYQQDPQNSHYIAYLPPQLRTDSQTQGVAKQYGSIDGRPAAAAVPERKITDRNIQISSPSFLSRFLSKLKAIFRCLNCFSSSAE